MAYDEELADRLREHLAPVKRITEREMFGGISFMIGGNLCCGVLGADLIVRIDPTLHHDALTRPNVSEFSMGGRTSKGMIRVSPAGVADEGELALWLRLGIAHATAFPPRKAGAKKSAPPKKKKAPPKKEAAPPKKKAAVKKATKRTAAPAKKKKAAPVKKKKAPVKKARAAVKKRAGRARK
ncbi:MAG: TfoX/Sxy family protein [Actinobacteria bacterium]|nr:MAG: TfoX/Sxy family protein [Actinomycetota bacterium]